MINLKKLIGLIGLFYSFLGMCQTAYYLSPIGSDLLYGNKANPWKTIDHALDKMAAGDTLYFYTGNYGDFTFGIDEFGNYDQTFRKQTYFIEIPGESVVFGKLTFGSSDCSFRENGCSGTWDEDDGYSMSEINLTLSGFDILEGVEVSARNVVFDNCRFKIPGPWNGSVEAIEKSAVLLRLATNITIKNSDISESGFGVHIVMCQDIKIQNNTIHDLSQDGITLVTATNVLIEGNTIRNLYDGVGDNEGVDWNRHCDGIQMYPIIYNENVDYGVHDVTIRGNTFYHYEAMGIMVNWKKYDAYEITNLIVEDNIFCNAGAIIMHTCYAGIDGCIIRNNSVVDVPGDTFARYGKTFYPSSFEIRLPSAHCKNISIYNNIFAIPPVSDNFELYSRYDHNSIYKSNGKEIHAGLGYVNLDSSPFINPANRDGAIDVSSPLVNAGTRFDATWSTINTSKLYDCQGTIRDNKIDIGAYEIPGRNPAPEELPNPKPSNPTTFKDSFSMGFINKVNPFVYNDSTDLLTWKVPDAFKGYQIRFDRENLKSNHIVPLVGQSGEFMMVSDQEFQSASISFKSQPTLDNDINEGFLLFFVDNDNYYFYDIIGARFIKRLNGTEQIISNDANLKQSVNQLHRVEILSSVNENLISIHLKLDGDIVLTYEDYDLNTVNTFAKGGAIGVMVNNSQTYHRTVFDDFSVTGSTSDQTTIAEYRLAKSNLDIIVYPNPVIENATVHFPNSNDQYQLKLIDMTGKAVIVGIGITGKTYILNTDNLISGVYLLVVQNQRGDAFRTKLLI